MPLYQPSNVTPSEMNGASAFDATKGMAISWQVNGAGNVPMTAYRILIMRNDTASTTLYDTGRTALDSPFYGADEKGDPVYFETSISADTLMGNGILNDASSTYKFLITQWWTEADSVEQTSANVFICRNDPIVSVSNYADTVASIDYTFTGSYFQAQGDPIEWVRWRIMDNAGNDSLVDTGPIYNVGPLETSYNGFANGQSYSVRLDGSTINGVAFDTGWLAFSVAYETTTMSGMATACPRCDTDAIEVTVPSTLYNYGNGAGNWAISDKLFKSAGPGSTVTVTDAIAGNASTMSVSLVPVQPGSGDPSPANVRPISAAEQVTITVNGTDTTVQLPEDAYAGSLNVTTGEVSVTHAAVDMGDLVWVWSSANGAFTASIPDMVNSSRNCSCSCYTYASILQYGNNQFTVAGVFVLLKDSRFGQDAAALTAAVAGQTFVYELKSPQAYNVAATQVALYAGTNTVSTSNGTLRMQYAFAQNAGKYYLNLPTASDTVSWGSATEKLNYQAPWAMSLVGYVSETTLNTKVLTITTEDDTMTFEIRSNGITFNSKAGGWVYSYAFQGGERFAMNVSQDRVSMTVGTYPDFYVVGGVLPGINTGNVISAVLTGPLNVEYLWMVSGNLTAEQVEKTRMGNITVDSSTYFLARFANGLQAGISDLSQEFTQLLAYRKNSEENYLRLYAELDATGSLLAFRDYAALNGNEYEYYIFAGSGSGAGQTVLTTNSVTPNYWNYSIILCEKNGNGYRVQAEYRFALEVSSGTMSNNNKPTLQANFTPYPLRQPSSQNYRSATLTAYVGKAVNGQYVDTLDEITALREISTSTLTKFLKTRKGEIMMIETSDPITMAIGDKYQKQPVRAGIPWVEVGSAEGIGVITTPEDAYWALN